MATIGYATLQIIPSLKGVSAAIDKELGNELRGKTPKIAVDVDERAARRSGQKAGKALSDSVERETRGLGRKIGDAFDPSIAMGKVGRVAGTALKGAILGGVAGVGATIAGTVGATLFKGFERLQSIDDARAKLLALHNSVADVQTIMDSALASVKGTAFGLGDAATIAANAVAAGVKPGQDLTKYLSMTADAAALAGTNLGDMGQIINQVHTGQKAYTDDLNQLADRGLPIYQWLSDQLHISAADVKQWAADGKISAADFEQAIQTHIGGAARTMGTSFSGALQNAEAALGRLGAAFLQPAFTNAAGGLGSITTGLDSLTAWVDAHQGDIIGFWKTMGDLAITAAENVAHGVGGMLQAIGDLAGGLGNVVGVADDALAAIYDLAGNKAGADEFRRSAQEAYGWGESIRAAGDKLVNLNLDSARTKLDGWASSAQNAATQALNAHSRVASLGDALGALPPSKTVKVDADPGPAEAKMQTWWDKWKAIIAAPPAPTPQGPVNPLTAPLQPGQHATGGPIRGPGGPTADKIPAWLSNGEHVFTAKDVEAMGGQAGVYAFRQALHRDRGGSIFPLRDPRGIDPSGGKDPDHGDKSAPGPFAPWWDMDWMPPEHPEKIGESIPGVQGKWWHRGPTHAPSGGMQGRWAWPRIGPLRPPKPGERWPIEWEPGPKTTPFIGGGLGFAGGGAVGPDVLAAGALVGTAYSQANRTDCSGMVARVIDRTLGMPESGLMSTKNAAEWLAARGFKPGIGGKGQISVGWYDHGPNPNDGHMAMTLSDGSNAEAGGGVGDIFQIGGGAAGASNPEFDRHMYLPTVYGEGPAGSSAASSPFAGGSATAAVTGGGGSAAPAASSGGGTPSGGGSSFSLPGISSSLSGFGSSIGEQLGSQLSNLGGGKLGDLGKLGSAAGSFIDGQVGSLLDVFGVPSSPGWLKGISQLIGGISIGGGGGSAGPLAAIPTGGGVAAPDDPGNMHGNRAGQAPGPVYNITARDTEDAFVKAQRVEREKAAAKLSRF